MQNHSGSDSVASVYSYIHLFIYGRQKERRADNIREWTGLESAKSQRAVEKKRMEETGCEVICGAPTTPAVKG